MKAHDRHVRKLVTTVLTNEHAVCQCMLHFAALLQVMLIWQ